MFLIYLLKLKNKLDMINIYRPAIRDCSRILINEFIFD